ncbi:MAG: hypothetical protein FP814_09805 [Desulfobacterium sp.]|nr:hypothetical protein [Desulfobacteraceae bacterium]MBA3036775.1 hypothetical protein [Desulfobacterium sp.]
MPARKKENKMAKSIGVVKIKMDGVLMRSKPGASLDPGGPVRTPVDCDQPGFYSETNKNSHIDCDMVVDANFSADALRRADDFTATFESDTGQMWVVNHAWVAEPPVITGGNNGGAKLAIDGPPAQEMK